MLPNDTWHKRVHKMSDTQIIAIAARLLAQEETTTGNSCIYTCPTCQQTYSRDNDTLEYCELCGNKPVYRRKKNE